MFKQIDVPGLPVEELRFSMNSTKARFLSGTLHERNTLLFI